jgi:CBS domain-containing protein
MEVQQIMTTAVVTVGPETDLRDVARILVENDISGVPVCGARRQLLGIVSEGDILVKEGGPRDDRGFLARIRGSGERMARKARAVSAQDAMTAPVTTISPYSSVAEAARRMSDLSISRLPVVKNGELVGIVSRTDLVRAFVRSDEEIRQEITKDLLRRMLWLEEPQAVEVLVERGAVRLSGQVETATDAVLLERFVTRVPGVVSVDAAGLGWRYDDGRETREFQRYQLTASK